MPHGTAGSIPGCIYPWCAFGAPLSPQPCLGPQLQALSWLCLPTSGHGETEPLGKVPAPTCPMLVFPEPKHNQGLPTHYMVHHAPAWLTDCSKLPEADFLGLYNLRFLYTQGEEGWMLWFPSPSTDPHTCQRVRHAHGAKMPGYTLQCNWRNMHLLANI